MYTYTYIVIRAYMHWCVQFYIYDVKVRDICIYMRIYICIYLSLSRYFGCLVTSLWINALSYRDWRNVIVLFITHLSNHFYQRDAMQKGLAMCESPLADSKQWSVSDWSEKETNITPRIRVMMANFTSDVSSFAQVVEQWKSSRAKSAARRSGNFVNFICDFPFSWLFHRFQIISYQ